MQQSSSGIVASIILIVGLAVAFAVGIRYISAGLASTALPAPTATVQPTEVVGPSLSTPSANTRSGGSGAPASGQGAPATPTVTPLPAPTATPNTGAKVVTSTDVGAGETAVGVTQTFATSVGRVWCVAQFPHLHVGDALSFKWVSRTTNALIFRYDAPAIAVSSTDVSKASFLYGPLSSGRYGCDVLLNSQPVGGATFTVQ
jgi:hypothetical protein